MSALVKDAAPIIINIAPERGEYLAKDVFEKGKWMLGTCGGWADGSIGYTAGSSGTVTVDGAGSTLIHTINAKVGFYGIGVLTIVNGGDHFSRPRQFRRNAECHLRQLQLRIPSMRLN